MKISTLIAAFALSAIVFGSGSAFAANNPTAGRGAAAAGTEALSPEKQSAYEAMMKEHFDRVAPIQDKLNAKSLELNALSRNVNARPETISRLAGEVADLQARLRAERRALGDRMEKELGIRGYGMHGGMGAGMMNGHGNMMGSMMDGMGHGGMMGAGMMGGHRGMGGMGHGTMAGAGMGNGNGCGYAN